MAEKFSGPLVRPSRCEVRDHINYRKNDRWPLYRFYRALQRQKSPMRYIREGEPRVFWSFSTQSARSRPHRARRFYSGNPAFRRPMRNRSRSSGRRNGRTSRGSLKDNPGSSRTKPSTPCCASVIRPRWAAAEANMPCASGNDGLKSIACLAQATASAKRSACRCDHALTVCQITIRQSRGLSRIAS
jgi:hypothetical protein